jgi:hypothetical protein
MREGEDDFRTSGSPRSHALDFKLFDPMKPASPQVRGDRVVFYIQVESRDLDALKKDELLPFDSLVPGIEPSLVVFCSSIEDSFVVAEHFKQVLPQIRSQSLPISLCPDWVSVTYVAQPRRQEKVLRVG